MDEQRYIRVLQEEIEEILATEGEFRRWCKGMDRRRLANTPGYVPGYEAMDAYVAHLGKIEMLSHERVAYLSKRVQAGLYAEERLRTGESDDWLRRLAEIGQLARNQMVIANIPLVLALSRRYQHGDLPYVDFVQAGTTGLVQAIDRYDYRRGYKFSTYAAYWIRRAFQEVVEKEDGLVSLSHLASTRIKRMRYLTLTETDKTGRTLSRAEIAEQLDTTEGEVALLQQIAEPIRSLDEPLHAEGEETPLADYIVDEAGANYDEEFDKEALLKEVDLLLGLLNKNDRFIVSHFFGIAGVEQMDAEQIADCLGFTKRTVEVYLYAALRRLRFSKKAQLIHDCWTGGIGAA